MNFCNPHKENIMNYWVFLTTLCVFFYVHGLLRRKERKGRRTFSGQPAYVWGINQGDSAKAVWATLQGNPGV